LKRPPEKKDYVLKELTTQMIPAEEERQDWKKVK